MNIKTIVVLWRWVLRPDQIHYEIEIRYSNTMGDYTGNSKGSISKSMYYQMKGNLKEAHFRQGFYVTIEDNG